MRSALAPHVRRFFRGFRRGVSPGEAREARALLGDAELLLFTALQARERRHALDVLHWLRAHADPAPSRELLAAALVHNAGKGPLHLHERVIFVLLETFAPRLLARLADRGGRGGGRLPRALARQRDHPRLGAARLAEIGSAPRIRELVRRHHDASAGGDRELAWLMEADRRC